VHSYLVEIVKKQHDKNLSTLSTSLSLQLFDSLYKKDTKRNDKSEPQRTIPGNENIFKMLIICLAGY
jgi:hypothetical protein